MADKREEQKFAEFLDKMVVKGTLQNMMWRKITEEHLTNKYKKCEAKLSENCPGIAEKDRFHGKRCPDCTSVYMKDRYERIKREKKKEEKRNKRSTRK